jgi:DNA-binding beta-propeller fold protein YncE
VKHLRIAALIIAVLFPAVALRAKSPKTKPSHAGYHVTKKITLGGEGGWDYLTCDSQARRLYISRATRVMVLDADSGKSVGEIPDTEGVHGIALAPALGKGFTSNGRANDVSEFDLKTLKVEQRIKTGEGPDAILFDPATSRVFTFNGHSHDSTAIDAKTGKVIKTFPLDGKPEFAVSDGRGKVFVNLEDKSQLLAIDANKLTVDSRWDLSPCQEPSGLAIDTKNRRLFAGCDNKLMAIVNADTGKVITTLPIGEGVDATAFDPGQNLAFSSNGRDANLTIIHEDSPDKFSVVDNVPTQKGARTMALDTKTKNVYLVTADFGATPPATADHPRPRPAMVPNTFVLLVVGKK